MLESCALKGFGTCSGRLGLETGVAGVVWGWALVKVTLTSAGQDR